MKYGSHNILHVVCLCGDPVCCAECAVEYGLPVSRIMSLIIFCTYRVYCHNIGLLSYSADYPWMTTTFRKNSLLPLLGCKDLPYNENDLCLLTDILQRFSITPKTEPSYYELLPYSWSCPTLIKSTITTGYVRLCVCDLWWSVVCSEPSDPWSPWLSDPWLQNYIQVVCTSAGLCYAAVEWKLLVFFVTFCLRKKCHGMRSPKEEIQAFIRRGNAISW
jgi:hypothetical protein